MAGKLYVVESGSDAAGKHTQTDILYKKILEKTKKVRKIEFPNYSDRSSFAVKMYLNGDFSEKPSDVNAYAASTFYAIDRYITYQKSLKDFYESGGIIVADRYSTSNMVYQAGKIDDDKEREKFLEWLFDLEFRIYGLPYPSQVFYLDVPFEVSAKLLSNRRKKNAVKDIHEEDKDYLRRIYERAFGLARKYDWKIIDCAKDGQLLRPEQINKKILANLEF